MVARRTCCSEWCRIQLVTRSPSASRSWIPLAEKTFTRLTALVPTFALESVMPQVAMLASAFARSSAFPSPCATSRVRSTNRGRAGLGPALGSAMQRPIRPHAHQEPSQCPHHRAPPHELPVHRSSAPSSVGGANRNTELLSGSTWMDLKSMIFAGGRAAGMREAGGSASHGGIGACSTTVAASSIV